MDERDFNTAEAFTDDQVETGIRRAISLLPKQPPRFDGKCVECDDPIPPGRLCFGAITCVHCQQQLERRNPHLYR